MTKRSPLCLMLVICCLATPSAMAQGKKEEAQPPDRPPVDELMSQADAIASQITQIRGLPLKAPMNKGVRTRQELRQTLLTRIAQEYSDEDIAHEELVLKRLHLLPQELDYKQTLIDLLTEQIAGFYDQQTKELYIMQGLPAALQRPTMAHEIFHVLQDQHFDILAMQAMFKNKDNGDFHMARSAMLEGDATVLMLDFTLYEAGSLPQENIKSIVDNPLMNTALTQLSSSNLDALESFMGAGPGDKESAQSAMSRAPRIIREQLIFPYLGGLRFVIQARQGRTWQEFDQLYSHAPVSTEQILHPERYFAHDEPTILEFDAAPTGASKIYDNVFGEFQLGLALKVQLKEPLLNKLPPSPVDPYEAAEGWGGDRMVAYKLPDGQVVLVHLSSWDTPKDATQYYKALKASVERRYSDAAKPLITKGASAKYGQATCYTQTANTTTPRRHYIEQWGDLVLYIDGAPHSAPADAKAEDKSAPVYTIRDAVWSSLKRVPFDQVRQQHIKQLKASAP